MGAADWPPTPSRPAHPGRGPHRPRTADVPQGGGIARMRCYVSRPCSDDQPAPHPAGSVGGAVMGQHTGHGPHSPLRTGARSGASGHGQPHPAAASVWPRREGRRAGHRPAADPTPPPAPAAAPASARPHVLRPWVSQSQSVSAAGTAGTFRQGSRPPRGDPGGVDSWCCSRWAPAAGGGSPTRVSTPRR